MTTTPPPRSTCTPRVVWIDPRLGAAALRAPAASREDYLPQAILKLHRPSSLDYRARHGPLVIYAYIVELIFYQSGVAACGGTTPAAICCVSAHAAVSNHATFL